MRDTTINFQLFKFDTSITQDISGKDSVLTTIYYIKQNHFLSLFNQGGLKNLSLDLGFAGFTIFFYKEAFSFTMRIENIRKLTKEEEIICEAIYSKTKKSFMNKQKIIL